jgi:hypothetical protein
MSANIKASTDGTQAIIGVGGVDQMTVSNAGVVTANSFVGAMSGNASSATALATGSTTARTLANRFADVVNVKDFGAVGDGVADDAAAIQAAVTAAQAVGGEVFFPAGVYRVRSQITITSTVSIRGPGKPGHRVYTSSGPYGGAEIMWEPSATLTDPLLPSSFAISVDTGSIGAEGFANVSVDGIGFFSPNIRGGGIYVEGAAGVTISRCRFAGGLTEYSAGTNLNVGIFARNMITSRIDDCTFWCVNYAILGDDFFNENVISRCDFERIRTLPIGIWSVTNFSVRNTIRDSNFIGDPIGAYDTEAIVLAGGVKSVTVQCCTFEILRKIPIVCQEAHPITAVSLGATPSTVSVLGNLFIACGGGLVGSVCVSFAGSDGHVVSGNGILNPTAQMVAMIGTLSAVSGCYAIGNNLAGKGLVIGDPTKVVQDDALFRSLPQDASEASKAGWTVDNPAALWQNGKRIRGWNGDRFVDVVVGAYRQDSTGAPTPNITGISVMLLNPIAPYSITNLVGGHAGQRVMLYNQSAQAITVTSGGNFLMQGGVNLVLTAAGHAVEMVCLDGSSWIMGATRTP